MTTTQQSVHASAEPDSASRSGKIVLSILLGGTFMAALDAAIANVAGPEIEANLNLSGAALVLALSSYTLAYAMLLITGARLGDDHGHRGVFILGLGGFTAASLVCGVAPNGATLIAARIVQGSACAMMTPQVATIIQLRYEGTERARALALFAMVLAVGIVAGQAMGGLLVSGDLLGLSWRPVFLINVPVGIALVLGARRTLPHTRAPERRRLDLPGVVLCAAALLLIMLPLLLGREQAWPAWTFAALGSGVALAVIVAGYFRRLARRGASPLIDPQIVADGGFATALASLAASTVAWGGFLFVFTLYLQDGLHYSPLHSGLAFIPYGVGFAVASVAYGRLSARLRMHLPYVGLAVLALAYAALGLVDRTAWHLLLSIVGLGFAGTGYGLGFSPMMTAAVAGVPPQRARDASGIITTAIQVSYAVGLTALGSMFLGRAQLPRPHASGHAFATVSIVLAMLSLAAAMLAAAIARRAGAIRAQKLVRGPLRRLAYRRTAG